MNHHRRGVRMFEFDGPQGTVADRSTLSPAWDREKLIRQFQQIDSSTRTNAEREVAVYERRFLGISQDSVTNRK